MSTRVSPNVHPLLLLINLLINLRGDSCARRPRPCAALQPQNRRRREGHTNDLKRPRLFCNRTTELNTKERAGGKHILESVMPEKASERRAFEPETPTCGGTLSTNWTKKTCAPSCDASVSATLLLPSISGFTTSSGRHLLTLTSLLLCPLLDEPVSKRTAL